MARMSLKEVIATGRKNAPLVTKVAVGALVLFSVAIAIFGSRAVSGALFVGAIGILVVGALAALLSRAVFDPHTTVLGKILASAVVGAFVFVGALFISAALFGVPRSGAVLLARGFDTPGLIPDADVAPMVITRATQVGALPAVFTEATEPRERFDRIAELKNLPVLRIDGGTLVLNGTSTLRASKLILNNGGIITNGSHPTIEVIQLVSSGGWIRSHPESSGAPPEKTGHPGGDVELIVHDDIIGVLSVSLEGQDGGTGKNGKAGARGPHGAQGHHAASGLFDCSRGAGSGGAGGKGGPGEAGTAGGAGGGGGNLVVKISDPQVARETIRFAAPGGAGGVGGRGGAGGAGGNGGPGGSARGLCQGGGPSGPDGPAGPPGPSGPNGDPGTAGTIAVRDFGEIAVASR